MEKGYKTIRAFLTGKERDEETYFSYSATLRIYGEISSLEEISARLNLQPTSTHRKGEKKGPRSLGFRHDMWSYSADLDESEPLERHIDALWTKLKPHKNYLRRLKKSLTVNVFLGYRSNSGTAGFEVPCSSLEMFTELEIPFGVSVIIA
jgi:Domain of unknown function (DUF4279)